MTLLRRLNCRTCPVAQVVCVGSDAQRAAVQVYGMLPADTRGQLFDREVCCQ